MKTKELFKRYTLFVLCLFFMGLGIGMTKHAELGVSAISSLSDVLSMKFTIFSFGAWITITNIIYIIGQIVLLRKNFDPIQLLQLPLSFLFGYFTDFGAYVSQIIPNNIYIIQFLTMSVGVFFLGFGIALGVIANTILTSAEGLVKAISVVFRKNFSNVKIAFDIIFVIFAIICSLWFFDGKIMGVREGTLFSAIFTGIAVKISLALFEKPLEKFLTR